MREDGRMRGEGQGDSCILFILQEE
jgi:hypothetical protein